MEDIVQLLDRIFAVGHELVGVRVTAYGPIKGIWYILNALDEDEREVIQNSSFGKFVSLTEKPSYSNRFGRFLLSRQLKVLKMHKIWFLFAGNLLDFRWGSLQLLMGCFVGNFQRNRRKDSKTTSRRRFIGLLFLESWNLCQVLQW